MSKQFFIDAHKLLVEGTSRVEIFTYRPENVEREALGGLFIVGELVVTGHAQPNDFFTLNSLASVIKREYYATPSDNPLLNLEEALKAANAAFGHLLQPASHIAPHLIVAVVSGKNLHFARLGIAHVFLNRQGTWLNLSRVKPSAEPKHRRRQLFTNIVTGKIQDDDSVIIATHGLLPFIQQETFRQRLSTVPFEDAAAFVQKSLARLGTEVSVGLLQLEIHESNPLKPPLAVAEFEGAAPVLEKIRSVHPAAAPLGQAAPPASTSPVKSAAPPFWTPLKKLATAQLSRVAGNTARFKAIAAKIAALKAKRSTLTAPANHLVQGRPIGFLSFEKNPLLTKTGGVAVGAITGLIIIIIIAAVIVSRQPSPMERLQTEFNQIVERLTPDPAAGPAAEWRRLAAIISELEALPNSAALTSELKATEANLRLKASGATPVGSGQQILRWSDLSFTFKPVGLLAGAAGQFIAYDNQSLVRADALPAPAPSFTFLPHPLEAVRAVTPPEAPGETVYLINPLKLTQGLTAHLAGGGRFTELALFKPYEKMTIADAAFYNGRLYVLEAAQPQILRYDPAQPENQPTLWLTASPDTLPSQPLALAVDGTIFVANRETDDALTVRQYIGGRQTKIFSFRAADLSTITRLFTTKDSATLYILDSDRGVILALNKATGKIQQRLASEVLRNALDFLVMADNRVLALNAQDVFALDLPE